MNQHEAHPQEHRILEPILASRTLLTFDIGNEVCRLKSEPRWQAGHTANTIVKYPDFRIVMIALKAGGRMHEHRTAGCLSIHSLSGEIRVQVQGKLIQLAAGKLLCLDRDVPHDVEATTDSVFLLAIAWPNDRIQRYRAAREGLSRKRDHKPSARVQPASQQFCVFFGSRLTHVDGLRWRLRSTAGHRSPVRSQICRKKEFDIGQKRR